MWLFTNDFKHRHIIYRWKWILATIKNSRSLPQNNAPFGSDPLTKFVVSVRKKYADDPSTFITNGRYHCDQKVERKLLAPMLAAKTGWRTAGDAGEPRPSPPPPTTVIWHLGSHALLFSPCSTPSGLARASWKWAKLGDHKMAVSVEERERKVFQGERKRERDSVLEKGTGKEEGGQWWPWQS